MTRETGFAGQRGKTIGDVAVDGLLSGMAAGLVMGIALLLLGIASGSEPGEMLGRFDPGNEGSPLAGGLMHLAVSGLYGIVFALAGRLMARWTRWQRHGWWLGVVYGLGLWLAAQWVLLPGTGSTLTTIPRPLFATAHVIYGAVLGFLVGRHTAP